MSIEYVVVRHLTGGEPIEDEVLVALLDLEFVRYRRSEAGGYEIADDDCELFRAMLRMSSVLGINPAGIETIVHMRERMREMQAELRLLQAREATREYRRRNAECIES